MRHRISVLAALLACALVPGVSANADEMPTMEQVRKHLRGIKANVTNANLRIRHGGSTRVSDGTEVKKQQTPGLECCSVHIKKIRVKVELLTQAFSEWDRYYAERENADALEKLTRMREQLNGVAIGNAQFRMAVSKDRSIQALQGLVPPYLALVRTTDELDACCPLPVTAESESAKGKREK